MHANRSRHSSLRGIHDHASLTASLQHSINRSRTDVLDSIFSEGFPYSRSLNAHQSCINALAFSNGEGQFLASGGDDLKILLWDFYQEDVREPIGSFIGPRSNILHLTFSPSNRYLFSGGIDDVIFRYDVSYLGSSRAQISKRTPDATCTFHDDTIRGITCRPNQDEVYLSGSEDGRIIRHDEREASSPRAQDTLRLESEVTGLQYHPQMDYMFLTSDQNGSVCLRDERMAFGPLSSRSNNGVVQEYNTKLTRPNHDYLSNPETSSIAFDRDGSRFAVTMLHWYPTIYSISDPNPLAICTGKNTPDGTPIPAGERTYSNSCTMKHGSFGGPGLEIDEFYAAGSDDFRGYIWRLPPDSELAIQRQEISPGNWQKQEYANETGFAAGARENIYIPTEISTPLCRLTGGIYSIFALPNVMAETSVGHDSIVNTVVFHPHFLHVMTSGVERRMLLHSPTPSSPCAQDLPRSPTHVRQLDTNGTPDRFNFYQALVGAFTTVGESEAAADMSERRTISMFDHIWREEGDVDVFIVRPWKHEIPEDNSSDEDEDTESEDDAMDILGI
ncbi:hypothetical protein AGABI1DRAFT_128379 [Agaricus bisporus var. burnettii JB137-S8]|uniref:Uncharacterized protein n=1 Tax=Agaricus bisporus var. burnettii (strain JB137-S8 / ATCC MYA-4627 / FGSC 10392) TaxID=597362 RepID=K5X7P6_AGABU|nr:uncharacterized protein AGABI1DRAFT_128379 [Agaricus bisporus var. burnettii JB137-S8]EKM79218.1 hypothetical protein AGABI1DRAFT_128379 [Agaricus bisporus var. burnettii JB137-S8]